MNITAIPVSIITWDKWTAVSRACQAACKIGNPWNGGAPDYESVSAIYFDRMVVDWFRTQTRSNGLGIATINGRPVFQIASGINRASHGANYRDNSTISLLT